MSTNHKNILQLQKWWFWETPSSRYHCKTQCLGFYTTFFRCFYLIWSKPANSCLRYKNKCSRLQWSKLCILTIYCNTFLWSNHLIIKSTHEKLEQIYPLQLVNFCNWIFMYVFICRYVSVLWYESNSCSFHCIGNWMKFFSECISTLHLIGILIDFRNVCEDSFSFLSTCAEIIAELKLNSSLGIWVLQWC